MNLNQKRRNKNEVDMKEKNIILEIKYRGIKMKKFNSKISLILVVILLCSLTNTLTFADELNNSSIFDQYLISKGYSDNLPVVMHEKNTTSIEKGNLKSDEYIQMLLDKGISFEVKDIYYRKVNQKNLDKLITNDVIDIYGEKYIKINEVTEVNRSPQLLAYIQGDTRVRQVTAGSSQKVGSLSDNYNQFIQGSIMALIGYSHPVFGFVTAMSGLFPYSPEQYGKVSAEVLNTYAYTNVWHEVYDLVGFVPMVITESRRTNVTYTQSVVNKNTGKTTTNHTDYQGVKYEYSIYYGQLTRNLTQALNMYNAGLRNPEVYYYYTGTVIDNSHVLP